jgi:hypothetical protein
VAAEAKLMGLLEVGAKEEEESGVYGDHAGTPIIYPNMCSDVNIYLLFRYNVSLSLVYIDISNVVYQSKQFVCAEGE